MTSSYLGITGHYSCRHDYKKHTVVRILAHSHMAEHIRSTLDEVLKIMAVITDNGSNNMVKAFQQTVVVSDEEEEEEADTREEEIIEEDSDFMQKELDHEVTFAFYCKRLSCFSHTLQLVMLKFNEHSFKPLLKKVHALVSKVNKSSKATEALISLVRDCPTRWSSSYLMLEHLLEVKIL